MTKKILFFIFNQIILLAFLYSLFSVPNIKLSLVFKIIISIFVVILLIFYLVKKSKSLYYFILLTLTIVQLYCIILNLGLIDKIFSINELKNFILSTGPMGVFLYILIQVLQVVFLPIPAAIVCVVGTLIYGPILGFLYCTIGVILGSIISFLLGKIIGLRLLRRFIGASKFDNYFNIISIKGEVFLKLAFLLPLFPDDILCFISGISKLKFKSFLKITIFFRPIGVFFTSIFGSGTIIPFKGWGIYVWLTILISSIITILILFINKQKIRHSIVRTLLNH